MTTRDLHLLDLYRAPRDPQQQSLAARHAPLINFDRSEPFLPLAAGYTIFDSDSPSPSMDRLITLRPAGHSPAVRAIEYAIWWDWDIHHLYELEHAWVYLDKHDQPVRVEASWHGGYNPIPLQMQDGRAVLFSEPGKHAFAPGPDWFRKRAAEIRRVETYDVSVHAGVLINGFTRGKVRQRVFDATLVRSFLAQRAFQPTWDFSKQFVFDPVWLVPWPALLDWIPGRMKLWLERLENTIQPAQLQALHVVNGGSSPADLQTAATGRADMVLLPIHAQDNSLWIGNPGHLPLLDAFDFLRGEPMGALLQPVDHSVIGPLAEFVLTKEVEDHAVLLSADPVLLQGYRERVSQGKTALVLSASQQDPLQAASESGATFVQLLPAPQPQASVIIDQLHQAGFGVISWPTRSLEERDALQKMGFDIVYQPAISAGYE